MLAARLEPISEPSDRRSAATMWLNGRKPACPTDLTDIDRETQASRIAGRRFAASHRPSVALRYSRNGWISRPSGKSQLILFSRFKNSHSNIIEYKHNKNEIKITWWSNNMEELSHFFPLSVYKTKLGLGKSYREQLIHEVKNDFSSKNFDHKNNKNAWTGDLYGFEFLHERNLFEDLFRDISKYVEFYCRKLNISENIFDFYYTRSWATVAYEQQDIEMHQHMQSHISAVYYLNVPKDSGNLLLEPFRGDNQNEFIPGLLRSRNFRDGLIKTSLYLSPGASINVETDDIIIFPSKTRHGTEKSKCQESRMSISADIVAVLKDSGSREFFFPPLDKWQKF